MCNKMLNYFCKGEKMNKKRQRSLIESIEKLRNELNLCLGENGINSNLVLELSEAMDELILKYYDQNLLYSVIN
jgi:hypothetical protein